MKTLRILVGIFVVGLAASAPADTLYEADYGSGHIYKFTPGGTQSTFASGLNEPTGLAFDSAGNLYEADYGSGHIYKFTPLGAQSTFASGLNRPWGLAFDSAGNLYEADYGSGHVYKFTPGGTQSTFASGLTNPAVLAFDSAGNLYEADYGSGHIYKFTPGGTQSTFASGLNEPTGLAFDSAGNLYVADVGTNLIYKFTPLGAQSTFASGLDGPLGLAFDSGGNLYESDYHSGHIYKLTPGGTQSTFASGLDYPVGLAFLFGNSWTSPSSGKWETATNWSYGFAPSLSDSADYITNAATKTVTIDATTVLSNAINGCMTISNLYIAGTATSTSTLFLNNAGTNIPLKVIGASYLLLDSNGAMVVNNSALVLTSAISGYLLISGFDSVGNNSLTISNGGVVYSYFGQEGNGSSNNTVLVTGTGSVWSNSSNVDIGSFSGGNHMIISNGAAVYSINGFVSDDTISSNNTVLVTGTGSVWRNSGYLYVGYDSLGNSLTIANGGAVYDANGDIGNNTTASNSSVLVTGTGSVWSSSSDLYVGEFGVGNSLTISSSGTVFDSTGVVGDNPSASNNMAVVTGSGSAWSNSNNLYVGLAGGFNNLLITNGGAVFVNGYGSVGDSSPSNAVLVSGPGSVWNNQASVYVGASGSGNSLTITNGGAVFNDNGFVGENSSANNNAAVVTGPNSAWSNSGNLDIGDSGAGNTLTIANGGTVNCSGNGQVGASSTSSNNSVLVTGTGSVWSFGGFLAIGDNGLNNALTITNGGQVFANNIYVSVAYSNPGNQITISAGGLNANSALDIRSGTLTFNGGTVTVNQLVLTNGANSVFTFKAGLLTSGGTFVTNNQIFIVGDGTDAAAFQLNGGVHSFANNLVITNNGTLTGCGTINGNVVVGSGGTIVSTCATQTFTGTVTNNGTIIATNGATIIFDQPVVNYGAVYGPVQFMNGVSPNIPFVPFPDDATHSNMSVMAAIANVPTNVGVVYDANGQTNDIQIWNFGTGVYTGAVDVSSTLQRIRNGESVANTESDDGGFFNFNPPDFPNIPRKGTNYYMEFMVWPYLNLTNNTYTTDVDAYGSMAYPGAMRLLIGLGGEVYFTGDHYGEDGPQQNAYYLVPSPSQAIGNSWTNAASGKWENKTNWNFAANAPSAAPSDCDPADLITNAGSKTITLDAVTAAYQASLSVLSINNLIVSAPAGSVNNLLLTSGFSNTLQIATSLSVLGGGSLTLDGGTLASSGTYVTNNQVFVVGDGIDAATFQMNGGIHSFANGLEIRNNATLTGCGTVYNNVAVDMGGTVVSTCGTLTFSGTFTNNGTVIAANGTTIAFDGQVVNNGTISGSVQYLGGCTATVTTSSSPAGGGTTSGGGEVACGSNATVCATASSGYVFANWAVNSNVVSTSTCYVFAPDNNLNLVANFAPFHITGVGIKSNNVLVTWIAPEGSTNVVQARNGGAGGSYSTNNFLPISPLIVIPGTNAALGVTTNYLDVGGAINFPVRYYRVAMFPTAQQTQWDLAGDWNPPANPNGAWTYGDYDGSSNSFVDLTYMAGGASGNGAYDPTDGEQSDGFIYKNLIGNAAYGIGAGQVSLESNWGTPVARWTAPTSGFYDITVMIGGTTAVEGGGSGNNFAQYAAVNINMIPQTDVSFTNNVKSWSFSNLFLSAGTTVDAYVPYQHQADAGDNQAIFHVNAVP